MEGSVYMRLKRTLTSLGLVALAVCAAVPATAAATNHPIIVENGTPLAVGSKFTATNVGVVKTTTGLGSFECSTAVMTGQVTKNTTGAVEADITSAAVGGTGLIASGAAAPECTTQAFLGGDTTATISTATNGLPWCLRATEAMNTDEFQIRGNSCIKASRPIRIATDITGIGTCTYERMEPIPGTFTTSTTDSVFSIYEVNFPSVPGNPFGCAGGFRLDMSFTMETDASPFTSLGITE
jgi:hypothetical protein